MAAVTAFRRSSKFLSLGIHIGKKHLLYQFENCRKILDKFRPSLGIEKVKSCPETPLTKPKLEDTRTLK